MPPSDAAAPARPAAGVEQAPAHGRDLQRRLGAGAATALVIGNTIAVGIFLTPAEINRTLASPFWILAIWLATGVMAICGALCYGALAARTPEAGGGYVYLREAYGPRVAFLYGWKCFLVMDPGITAALVTGLVGYVRFIVPLGDGAGRLLGVGVIALLAAANVSGVGVGVRLMGVLTVLKLALLAVVIAGGFASAAGSWQHFLPFVEPRTPPVPLGVGLAGAFVSAFMLVAPRLYFAMARDGLFPAGAAAVHLRFGTPARAIAVQAALASALVLLGTFQTIVAYFVFVTVAFIGVTAGSVLVLRRRGVTGLRVPGYPVTVVVFLAFVVVLLGLLLMHSPRESLTGAAIAALGLPVFRLVRAAKP